MDPAVIATWASDLQQRLANATSQRIPVHVVNRIAVLMHGQPLESVVVDVTRDPQGFQLGGTVAVFTSELLASVTLAGVSQPHPMSGERSSGEVDLVVVRRKTLSKLRIAPAGTDWVNYNDGWGMAPEKLAWPEYGQVRLTYRDLPDEVVLGGVPLPSDEPSPLTDLIPRLVQDLINSP